MILTQIIEAFKVKQERNWDTVYFLIDVHGTIFKKSYDNDAPLEYYPYAKEALQEMTKRNDVFMILWTCSHQEQIDTFMQKLIEDDIFFESTNFNPEIEDNEISCYESKPYCNVGIDDKFGFNPDEWKQILFHFQQLK